MFGILRKQIKRLVDRKSREDEISHLFASPDGLFLHGHVCDQLECAERIASEAQLSAIPEPLEGVSISRPGDRSKKDESGTSSIR